MNIENIKKINEFCEELFSTPDAIEVIEKIESGEDDCEVDNVRFISEKVIDDILADEIGSDKYTLGCFNASAIAEATDWPEVLIEAAQSGEEYEEIGNAMTDDQIKALANHYSSMDGYGHHFNLYDGNEEELTLNGVMYHVFDNH